MKVLSLITALVFVVQVVFAGEGQAPVHSLRDARSPPVFIENRQPPHPLSQPHQQHRSWPWWRRFSIGPRIQAPAGQPLDPALLTVIRPGQGPRPGGVPIPLPWPLPVPL
ncbi:uncharacterized protein LOC144099998 isoform X2 [Amblyomma americanum]